MNIHINEENLKQIVHVYLSCRITIHLKDLHRKDQMSTNQEDRCHHVSGFE